MLLVGGGDGTVSAAAAALRDGQVALGILPAGTMNLFARTLQIPLDLEQAVAALAAGTLARVDYATANGEPFVHQYALGLHARMVRMREKIQYGSRIGKIMATTRAVYLALRRLPRVEITLDVDGVATRMKSTAVAISNNLYGPGHIPYADDPQGGVLGVYICTEKRVGAVMKLTLDIMMGTWRHNPSLTVKTARHVLIEYGGKNHKKRAVRDGELVLARCAHGGRDPARRAGSAGAAGCGLADGAAGRAVAGGCGRGDLGAPRDVLLSGPPARRCRRATARPSDRPDRCRRPPACRRCDRRWPAGSAPR